MYLEGAHGACPFVVNINARLLVEMHLFASFYEYAINVFNKNVKDFASLVSLEITLNIIVGEGCLNGP